MSEREEEIGRYIEKTRGRVGQTERKNESERNGDKKRPRELGKKHAIRETQKKKNARER